MLPGGQTPKTACAETHDREAGPDLNEVLTQALKRLEELCAYGRYYVRLRIDEAQAAWHWTCRQALIKVFVGLALTLFCVEIAVLILSAVSAGIAQSTQWPAWIVQIASGLTGLLLGAGAAFAVFRTLAAPAAAARKKRVEEARRHQRVRWGRDVEQAAHERARRDQAREELGGNGHPAGRLRAGTNPWHDRRSATVD